MSNIEIGLAGFAALFVLLGLRMPVGTAMLAVGVAGIWAIHPRGGEAAVATWAARFSRSRPSTR